MQELTHGEPRGRGEVTGCALDDRAAPATAAWKLTRWRCMRPRRRCQALS